MGCSLERGRRKEGEEEEGFRGFEVVGSDLIQGFEGEVSYAS